MAPDSPKELNEYELLRQRNMQELAALLADDEEDKKMLEAISSINALAKPKPAPKRKRRSSSDAAFTFTGYIPLQRRKSARLGNKDPEYNMVDDIEEIENMAPLKRKFPRTIIRSSKTAPVPTIAVEDITEEMLANIATNSTIKTYSTNGTTCHQCRQKTADTKTVCRSGSCIGVRGYFCGPCLRNRYGEDVAVALTDPQWQCPVCRRLCNCSFCRAREGKRPTGILAPLAFQNGFNSVKDFLADLDGVGDYLDEDESQASLTANEVLEKQDKKEFNSEDGPCLLGFDSDRNFMMDEATLLEQ